MMGGPITIRRSYDYRAFEAPVSLILALILLVSCPVYAQVAGATLAGTVTDASGAQVSGAKVSIRNTATGVERHIITDSASFYSAPNLLPGTYDITVTAPGFSTYLRTGLNLTVGRHSPMY
jgi:hypothetical protein